MLREIIFKKVACIKYRDELFWMETKWTQNFSFCSFLKSLYVKIAKLARFSSQIFFLETFFPATISAHKVCDNNADTVPVSGSDEACRKRCHIRVYLFLMIKWLLCFRLLWCDFELRWFCGKTAVENIQCYRI